jgi:putative DNA primase/helicase
MSDGDPKPASGPGDRAPPSSAELLDAALSYAVRGWPVFPCNPKNKQPLLGADRDENDKPIKGTGGLKKASTDPEQISAWWKRWPHALIGLCTGHPTKGTESGEHPAGLPLFVLDFDPRADGDTGEIWTLQRLKSETEKQIATELPESLAVLTPSDGVHLYLLAADGGDAIRNRGNLPDHVDVRGMGGYVIAPPSVLSDGRRYRLHRKEPMGGIARAPAQLLEVLRDRGGVGVSPEKSADARKVSSSAKSQLTVDDAVRKYALAGSTPSCRQSVGRLRGAAMRSSTKVRSRSPPWSLGARSRRHSRAWRWNRLRATMLDATTNASCRRRSTAAGQQG